MQSKIVLFLLCVLSIISSYNIVDAQEACNNCTSITKSISQQYSRVLEINANEADSLIFPLTIDENDSLVAFSVILHYDVSIIKFREIKKTEISNTLILAHTDYSDIGELRIAGFVIEPIYKSGTYLEIIFDIIGKNSQESVIEIVEYFYNGKYKNDVNTTISIGHKKNLIPQKHALLQNYPNPFNPKTIISFQIMESANVNLAIYNMLGEQVKLLVDENKNIGYYNAIWNGLNNDDQKVPSGTYLYRVQVGDFFQTRKMILMR